MIRIEHLRKTYENAEPLRDINLEIRDGEVISVIGPSGTGKSTFLRCLNLLEKPTSGRIWINGTEITDKKCDISKVRQKIGFVFQSFNIYGHLTVVENVMYARVKLLHKSRQEAYDKAMELLDQVGLSGKALQYASSLSGGQKQRVAIARTLAMEPDILLFDEPTSALDPLMVGEVTDVIRDLVDRGKTMIIVTHEMAFARNISDRILFFADGIVYEQGTPEEIFEHPQKEKTLQFMKQIAVMEQVISAENTDLYTVMTETKRFALKQELDFSMINRLQLLIEEIVVSYFRPAAAAAPEMKLVLKYDRRTGCVSCSFYHNLDQALTDRSADRLPSMLVNGITRSVTEKESDDAAYRAVIECVL